MSEAATSKAISVEINGESFSQEVEARRLLVHFIRDECEFTGTHVGCDTGNCGACTVIVNGDAVKSCMMLAVQADGREVRTVESLASEDGGLAPLQLAFHQHHGLQCGYCTPGMLMSATYLLEHNAHPTRDEIKHAIQGNLCRCTGYQNILKAIEAVAEEVIG